ncbi:MAG TPA: helix-turn-helix transcriptional regulator [Candidatus Janibacter merdipullorum]|nr:helix-turn-helix transcriptional regulator [Candidatus Janibacter merdipullorum]
MSEAGRSLREWRRRRHLSQLELSHRVGVSTRHLSFVETGRSRPSSALVLRLCAHLDVPLREQNRVLVTAGHAPAHPERALTDVSMSHVSEAIEGILRAHEPFPALVVDRGWDLVSANDALYPLLDGVAEHLLEPPVNVIRLSLHPDGLAPRIVNLDQWREHLVHRIRRERDLSSDPRLDALLRDIGEDDGSTWGEDSSPPPDLLVPLLFRSGEQVLSFVSTTTVFGTPQEVTLSELAIEVLHPADAPTRSLLLDAN